MVDSGHQVYPEFLITYKERRRRTVRAVRPPSPSGATNSPTATNAFFAPRTTTSFFGPGPTSTRPSANQKDPPAASLPPEPKPLPEGTAAKMCVVCWEMPVSRILIPCGHPCLCDNCSTAYAIRKLNKKCPECRAQISQAVKFYGTVVES